MKNHTRRFFEVEFSVKEDETEFNQMVANYRNTDIYLNVEKRSLRKAIYRVNWTAETNEAWQMLYRMYGRKNKDQMRKENGERFHPIKFNKVLDEN
jgi:hypothetical protein